MPAPNTQFEFKGVNHLALVCKDMARTVEFYRDVLGMPLVKTIDLPGGRGQHFFFDMGNGDSLAFCPLQFLATRSDRAWAMEWIDAMLALGLSASATAAAITPAASRP